MARTSYPPPDKVNFALEPDDEAYIACEKSVRDKVRAMLATELRRGSYVQAVAVAAATEIGAMLGAVAPLQTTLICASETSVAMRASARRTALGRPDGAQMAVEGIGSALLAAANALCEQPVGCLGCRQKAFHLLACFFGQLPKHGAPLSPAELLDALHRQMGNS